LNFERAIGAFERPKGFTRPKDFTRALALYTAAGLYTLHGRRPSFSVCKGTAKRNIFQISCEIQKISLLLQY
jgi:hypothetical protein